MMGAVLSTYAQQAPEKAGVDTTNITSFYREDRTIKNYLGMGLLYVVNDEIITADQAKLLNLKDIKEVTIIKDAEAAIAAYGEKGKNGAIVITMKPKTEN